MRSYYHYIERHPRGASWFQRLLANLAFAFAITKRKYRGPLLTDEDYTTSRALLKKGDIVLVGSTRRMSSLIIRGPVTHTLMHVGDEKLIHAWVDGVEEEQYKTLFSEYDTLAILRPAYNEKEAKAAVETIRSYLGQPFDFWFTSDKESLYCVELLQKVFQSIQFDIGLGRLPWRIVRRHVPRPADFLRARNADVVFLSKFLHEDKEENNENNKGEETTFIDRILDKVFLPFIPRFIVPNHLTALRMISVPFVAWLLLIEAYLIGGIVFVLSAFTDALDGAMARTRNQITEWGKMFDPFADKLLIGTAAIILVTRYISFTLATIIIVLEFAAIFKGVYQKIGLKQKGVQANIAGKMKMILQSVGVGLLVLSLVLSAPALLGAATITLYLAIFFAVVSLLLYKSI